MFIASPEYNASVTPLLKNTIDWISRVRERGEPPLAAYKNRVFALGGASDGAYGAMRSLMALRQVLELGCGALVIPDQIAVMRASDAFDEMDNLKDERAANLLKRVARAAHRHGAGDGVMDARDRLIVALDVPSVAAAQAMVERLGDAVSFYKIGYQLAFAGGLPLAETLIRANKQVFVDLKLHDIGNTVAKGVESVAKLGATFLTVHAYPQTMHAAVDARAGSKLRILAVTVLTSYDDADLAAAGYDFTVPELVAERAAQARDIGDRRAGLLRRGSGERARDRRRAHGAGDAGHPAGRRRGGRPEARHDAGQGDRGRRGLSGGRPADRGSGRSEGRGAGDRRRDRAGDGTVGRIVMAKGYWIPHLDVSNPQGFQAYRDMADAWHKHQRLKLLARGGRSRGGRRQDAGAQRAARVQFVRRGAGRLPFAGIFARPSAARAARGLRFPDRRGL